MMLEIDCRECRNCDAEKDCCKLYGSDPKKAVNECAANGFDGYKPKDA